MSTISEEDFFCKDFIIQGFCNRYEAIKFIEQLIKLYEIKENILVSIFFDTCKSCRCINAVKQYGYPNKNYQNKCLSYSCGYYDNHILHKSVSISFNSKNLNSEFIKSLPSACHFNNLFLGTLKNYANTFETCIDGRLLRNNNHFFNQDDIYYEMKFIYLISPTLNENTVFFVGTKMFFLGKISYLEKILHYHGYFKNVMLYFSSKENQIEKKFLSYINTNYLQTHIFHLNK